jgi:glyoxalase/bleomycin resistance protein/dioxygenase superfamily protein
MSLLGFGQPQTGVFQMAYVVDDIDASMQRWVEQLSVGPWFLLAHFTGERGTYRGQPAEADVALAMAFAGHMLVELIAPNDDKPSVYREAIDTRGYGFHHFGVGTLDYDAELARHLEQGHELAFQAWVPTGGRVGYVDTTAELPGYLELIEMDEATDTAFTGFYAASLGWDGSDPVRPFA